MDAHSESSLTILSAKTVATARQRVLLFFSLNGVAVTFVMENILLLWALQNGLSAPQVAVLSSFVFLTMPFMFLGRQLSARFGLVKAWSACWLVRYVFVLLMIPVPWLRGGPWEEAIPVLILSCTFALFCLRSMGMINTVPFIGAITEPADIGSFQAASHFRNNLSYATTLVLVNVVLGWRDTIGIYQLFLLAGTLAGFISVAILMRVPEPPGHAPSAHRSFMDIWLDLRRRTPLRRLVWTWGGSASLIALTAPIGILAVKNGYGSSDQVALFFIIVEVAGATMAAWLVGMAADHTGPRPLLILGLAMLLGPTLYWALAPETMWWPGLIGAFLCTGAAKGILLLALSHYLLASTQAHERMDLGIVMQMTAGAVSGVTGIVVAAGLLRLLAPGFGEGLDLYQVYFRIIAIAGIAIVVATAIGLPPLKDWAVRDVIGLLFSLTDMRTLLTLNRIRETSSDEEEMDQLGRLSDLASPRSEPVLRRFVVEGRLMTQARAIEVLSRIPFGEDTAAALIRVVEAGAFTNGWRAAELLGQRRIRSAIPALRLGLQSKDPFLAGKCMVALARLEDASSYPAIRHLFRTTGNPRLVVHGVLALQAIQAQDDLALILEKGVEREWPAFVLEEMALAIASFYACRRIVHRQFRRQQALPQAHAASAPAAMDLVRHDPELQAFLARHAWESLPRPLQLALEVVVTHGRYPRQGSR